MTEQAPHAPLHKYRSATALSLGCAQGECEQSHTSLRVCSRQGTQYCCNPAHMQWILHLYYHYTHLTASMEHVHTCSASTFTIIPTNPSSHLIIQPSVCLSIPYSIYPSVHLSICPSVGPSTHPLVFHPMHKAHLILHTRFAFFAAMCRWSYDRAL